METEPLERIRQIDNAVNKILVNDETKQSYLQRAVQISRLYKAILPDPAASDFNGFCTLINIIAQKIKNLAPTPPDTTDVMEQIEDLLDHSIVPTGYTIDEDAEADSIVDLSQIDFDQLRERFRTQHRQIEAERLRGAINRRLSEIIPLNRTRTDYQERFEQIIAEYNEAAIDVDTWFEQLIELANELNEEEQRAFAEQLSEEELAVFDLITRPTLELTDGERNRVKSISRTLLTRLQERLVLDWRNRQQSRAAVRLTVYETLDELPERYTQEIYDQTCEA